MADAPTPVEVYLARNESASNYFNPGDEEELREVAVRGIAVAIFGVLLFLAFLAFFLIRCILCTCCGKGMCARNKRETTTKVIAINVILCAIPVMLIWIGGGLLAWKANPIGDSLDGLVTTALNQTGLIRDDVGNITARVEQVLPPNADVDISALTDAKSQLDQVYNDIEDQRATVDHYTNIVKIIVIVLGAAAFALGIWGIVTLLIRRSFFMLIFMLAAALIGPCLWILGGVGLATHQYADRICEMMQEQVDGNLNPWVLEQARCAELANSWDEFAPTFEQANEEIRNLNSNITEVNSGISAVQDLPPSFYDALAREDLPPEVDIAASEVERRINNIEEIPPICVPFEQVNGAWRANDTTTGCTELKRSDLRREYEQFKCQDESVQVADEEDSAYKACLAQGRPITTPQFDQLLEAARKYEIIKEALPRIEFMARCGFIDRAFENILADNCDPIRRDLWWMMSASIVAAVGVMAASLYFCVCFRNIRHRKYHPGEGPKRGSGMRTSSSAELAAKSGDVRTYSDQGASGGHV